MDPWRSRIKAERVMQRLERDARAAGVVHHFEAWRAPLTEAGWVPEELAMFLHWLFTKETMARLRVKECNEKEPSA